MWDCNFHLMLIDNIPDVINVQVLDTKVLMIVLQGSDSLGLVSSEIERLVLQLREEEDDATSGLGATKQDPDGPTGQQFGSNIVHQQVVRSDLVFLRCDCSFSVS